MHSNRIRQPQLGKSRHGWNCRGTCKQVREDPGFEPLSCQMSQQPWQLPALGLFIFFHAKGGNGGAAGHRELPASLGRVFWYYKGGIIKGRQKKPLNHATKVNPRSWKTLPLCTRKLCHDLAGVCIQRLFCSVLAVTETCYLHEHWKLPLRNHPHCSYYTS